MWSFTIFFHLSTAEYLPMCSVIPCITCTTALGLVSGNHKTQDKSKSPQPFKENLCSVKRKHLDYANIISRPTSIPPMAENAGRLL